MLTRKTWSWFIFPSNIYNGVFLENSKMALSRLLFLQKTASYEFDRIHIYEIPIIN